MCRLIRISAAPPVLSGGADLGPPSGEGFGVSGLAEKFGLTPAPTRGMMVKDRTAPTKGSGMDFIYTLFSYDADSWHARPVPISAHKTLEGAMSKVPDWAKSMERDSFGDYEKNYTYFLIKKEALYD